MDNPTTFLPVDIWRKLFQTLSDEAPDGAACQQILPCVEVNKTWRDFAIPFLYRRLSFHTSLVSEIQTLEKFTQDHIHREATPLQWTIVLVITTPVRGEPDNLRISDLTDSLLLHMPRLRTFNCGTPVRALKLQALLEPAKPQLSRVSVCLGYHVVPSQVLRSLSAITTLATLELNLTEALQEDTLELEPVGPICHFALLTVLRVYVFEEEQEALPLMLRTLGRCQFPHLREFGLQVWRRWAFEAMDEDEEDPWNGLDEEEIGAVGTFMRHTSHITVFDIDARKQTVDALLKAHAAILPVELTLHYNPWKSSLAALRGSPVTILNINNVDEDARELGFLEAVDEQSLLQTIRFGDDSWRGFSATPVLLGHMVGYALKFERWGIKLVDRDGYTFRHSVPW